MMFAAYFQIVQQNFNSYNVYFVMQIKKIWSKCSQLLNLGELFMGSLITVLLIFFVYLKICVIKNSQINKKKIDYKEWKVDISHFVFDF